MADDDDQNEDEQIEDVEDEDGKKGGKKKLLIFIFLPLLLLGGGGGAAYYLGYLDSLLGIEKQEECHDDHGEVIDCPEDEHAAGEEGGHGKDDHAKADKKKKAKGGKDDHGKGGKEGKDGGYESAFLAVEPMLLNLQSEDGTPHILRLKIQLELEDPSQAEEVKAAMPRIVDRYQTYLRGMRVRDIQGSAGLYRLQIELLNRVNKAVAPIEIKDVLFQEVFVQ